MKRMGAWFWRQRWASSLIAWGTFIAGGAAILGGILFFVVLPSQRQASALHAERESRLDRVRQEIDDYADGAKGASDDAASRVESSIEYLNGAMDLGMSSQAREEIESAIYELEQAKSSLTEFDYDDVPGVPDLDTVLGTYDSD